MGVKNDAISYEDEEIELMIASKVIDRSKTIVTVEKVIKRFVDFIGGLVGTIMLVPITAVVFVANKISHEDGPIFYTQERIGKDGKIFKMYKFRSMVVGADEKLFEYLKNNEEARKEYKKYKKLKNDPRITKMGKFLRKTSLDEFPQFINVLKGDMSLVGPRPYLPREKDDMGRLYDKITLVKPGITGMWQVSGRSELTFKERLDMDVKYYYNWSLKTDVKLLLNTVKKVINRDGAR